MGSFTDGGGALVMRSCNHRGKCMSEIDSYLITQARRFITGANVHLIKTWIFCYETSCSNSTRRSRYETLLRDFVASNILLKMSRLRIEAQGRELTRLNNPA